MRILLNVFLVLVCFLACYFEDIYLCLMPARKGMVIPFTIRLRDSFQFDQEKVFGIQRLTALSQYTPLYTYVPDRTTETAAKLRALLDKIASLSKSNGTRQFVDYVKAGHGLDVPENVVKKLFRFPDLKNFVKGILTLEESILQYKIIEEPLPVPMKHTCEVLFPEPSGIVAFAADDVITIDAARVAFQEKVQQVFWQVDKDIREAVLSIVLPTFRPNLVYDFHENNKRIEKIINRYPSSVVSFQAGHVLVPFGRKLGEDDMPLVSAYRKAVEKNLIAKAPWTFIVILLIALFYSLILEKIIQDEWRKDPPYHLFISLLIITVFLLKGFLLLTSLPLVVLPFGALPLMLVLLQSDKVSAVWTTLTAGLLVSLFSGSELNILLFFSFSGIAAVIIFFRIQRRMHILFASLGIGAANALLCLSLWLDWGGLFSPGPGSWIPGMTNAFDLQLTETLGWVFIGGVAAGPIALALLPLLETCWHTASTFRLSRYADLQHPLLKELLTKTPATYQHSMTVAYLAQSVGEAVGANTLLLRIGAYYHDIGKVVNPRLFAENQSGKNPHDELDPHESARIIIDHVLNGEKIGRRMKLPQVILDFIIQHHGTQTVEFFHSKAVKQNREGRVLKKDFQYPGPRPRSVEAAIVMICDAVEAASRSLETPTHEAIENMVRILIVKRIADGQFDECRLSTGCLAQIVRALVNSLEASFHSRVAYPWQEKQKEKVKSIANRPAPLFSSRTCLRAE